jgi:hypothetical protein
MHRYYDDQTYFSPSGMYTVQALNHWLYKMVEEPVTLMPFLALEYCPPGTSHLFRHNRASIMEAAPSGCKAIMIHYQHEYERDGAIHKVSHFKTWVQSAGTWYECESLHYRARQRVRIVTEQDWEELHPKHENDDSVKLLTLIRMDADAAGWTMRRAGDRCRTVQWNQLADKEWVDGTRLTIKGPNPPIRPSPNTEPSRFCVSGWFRRAYTGTQGQTGRGTATLRKEDGTLQRQ